MCVFNKPETGQRIYTGFFAVLFLIAVSLFLYELYINYTRANEYERAKKQFNIDLASVIEREQLAQKRLIAIQKGFNGVADQSAIVANGIDKSYDGARREEELIKELTSLIRQLPEECGCRDQTP